MEFTSTKNFKKLYVSSLLLRYILQLIGNGYAITRSDTLLSEDKPTMNQQEIVATGIYPSASMMNHSCDPNIINIFVGQYLIVRASKDIAQNEEVFNCYGPNYKHVTTENRQEMLESQYYFTCKCKPCTVPRLQYFLERFNAMKCLKCNGALCLIKNSMLCMDCGDKPTKYCKSKILQAEEIFEIAQISLELGETEEALEKLKQCLNIRKDVLYKYNEDITVTLNLMAEIYKRMGRLTDSIKCLEGTIAAIRTRFGFSSVQLLSQLNELVDICFMYLEKTSNTTTDVYKNMLTTTKKYLDQVEASTSFNYGSWNKLSKDVNIKQREIVALHQKL